MSRSNESIPNRQMVVYALFLLGGETNAVHTEDIAKRCHELSPDSFSWTKYPAFPDKDIVRVALTDARKERNGAHVEGRAGQNRGLTARTERGPAVDGWILTPNGAAWVRENLARLEEVTGHAQPKEHRQVVLRQLKRIREHPLFSNFSEEPASFNPSLGEMADFLRCRVDAEPTIWANRFERLRTIAESGSDEIIGQFLGHCQESYEAQR